MPVVGILGCGRHLDVVVLAPEPAVSQPNAFEYLLLSEVTFFAAALLSWGWGFPWPSMRNKLALEIVLPSIPSSNLHLFTVLFTFLASPLSILTRASSWANSKHFALFAWHGVNVRTPRRKRWARKCLLAKASMLAGLILKST